MDYRQSGVDIDAGNEAVRRIKALARSTSTPACCPRSAPSAVSSGSTRTATAEPVLVSSADGVGTKLKVAFMTGRHDTVGRGPGQPLRQRHPRAGRPAAVLPRLPGDRPPVARCGRAGRRRRGARLPARTAARCSAARPPRCRASTRTASTTSPASSSALVDRARIVDGRRIVPGDVLDRRCRRRACTPTGTRWRAGCFSSGAGFAPETAVPELGRHVGDALLAPHRSYLAACAPAAGRGLGQGHGPHHRRRDYREPAEDTAGGLRRRDRSRTWTVPPLFSADRCSAAGSTATRCFARSTWASA